MWSHLNQSEIDPSASDTMRRVLARLGEYSEAIIQPLKLRPTGAMLLRVDDDRVEVRISAATTSVVLVIGPDADLAAEQFWLRTAALQHVPTPRLITSDLSNSRLPCSYLITSYIGGRPLDHAIDDSLVRMAARACGRVMRRMHQQPAPGFGRPTIQGRWLHKSWTAALRAWLEAHQAISYANDLLGPEQAQLLWEATMQHADLDLEQPWLLHGALGLERTLVTTGESIRLEALVRPGFLVAGDPLFDVACGLLPTQPAAFRQGFLEGYAAAGPLDLSQRLRLRRMSLLAMLVAAQTNPNVAHSYPHILQNELRLLNDGLE